MSDGAVLNDIDRRLMEMVNRPLAIGNTTIKNRLVLSPMTFLGHVAFRELISRYGGYGLLFSEMCSAKRIPNEQRGTSPCFRWRDQEKESLVLQIFGNDPASMARAARIVEDNGLFGIDINFGCSVSTISKQQCGAGALKVPDLAARIVHHVRKAVSIPLFVKFRIGWVDDPGLPVQMAKRFEDAGADVLTFHPRVAPDRRSRPPKWDYIARVKKAVSIPVFGNGNVFGKGDCIRMFNTTGCDGVSVGRMAIAKPWLFAMLSKGFSPEAEIYSETAVDLLQLLTAYFDSEAAVRRYKKFARYFSANFKFGHVFYNRILNAGDLEEIERHTQDFFSKPVELCSTPNMNLFV